MSIQTCERPCDLNEFDVQGPLPSVLNNGSSADSKKPAVEDNDIKHSFLPTSVDETEKSLRAGKEDKRTGEEDVSSAKMKKNFDSPPDEHVNNVIDHKSSSQSNKNDVHSDSSLKKVKYSKVKGSKMYGRPHGIVVDKVDPIHVKGVEITLTSKEESNEDFGNDNTLIRDHQVGNDDYDNIHYAKDAGLNPHHSRHQHHPKGNASEEMHPQFEWIAKQWSEVERRRHIV